MEPKIVCTREVARGKWLALQSVEYQDLNGKTRYWDRCVRCLPSSTNCETLPATGSIDTAAGNTTSGVAGLSKHGGIECVAIFALLTSSQTTVPETLLVRQFRPAIGRFTIEMPAGLVDPGESPAAAAFRELKEETGFTAKRLLWASPSSTLSPGIGPESMMLHCVEVNLDDPINAEPKQALGDDEHCDVLRIRCGGASLLEKFKTTDNVVFEGLYCLAVGLAIGNCQTHESVVSAIKSLPS
eukprot:Lankesteria_metandrocarpae@DN2221_c0_g1_i1.p1